MSTGLLGRIAFAVIAAGMIVAFQAGAANAVLTSNTLGCEGSAIVQSDDPDLVDPFFEADAEDEEVELPRAGAAAWVGSTTDISVNHSGSVRAVFGPFKIKLGDWSSANDLQTKSSEGIKDYEVPSWVPPFALTVEGEHIALGDPEKGIAPGECIGYVDVVLLGEWTESVLAIGIVAGTGVMVLLVISSGVTRKGP